MNRLTLSLNPMDDAKASAASDTKANSLFEERGQIIDTHLRGEKKYCLSSTLGNFTDLNHVPWCACLIDIFNLFLQVHHRPRSHQPHLYYQHPTTSRPRLCVGLTLA